MRVEFEGISHPESHRFAAAMSKSKFMMDLHEQDPREREGANLNREPESWDYIISYYVILYDIVLCYIMLLYYI